MGTVATNKTEPKMSNLSKVTCRRCGGSGSYSFNLRHGTMCYGCNGSGFQMIDAAKEASRKAAAAAKEAKNAVAREARIAATNTIIAELNAAFGPFDIETPLGLDKLNLAVHRATGKSIWSIRDERIAA